jgi:DNA primase
MAGRIRQSDVEELKARLNIADVVGDYVALKGAGVGSLKGLCPFHDERSPSFHVRPQVGYYHCFGCGESGDVYSFVQKMDHLSFTESIERLAARINFELHYEEGGAKSADGANRARLLAANAAAATFFQAQLATPGAAEGRAFLGGRGFDKAAASHFGVGYAPKAWNELKDALTAQGFTEAELVQAGLLSQGDKGVYDRFRGRVVWPIRDVTGQTVGFGARKLFDDDQGPKYLNTPDTPVYHKSQVLYGLDLAKRDVAKNRQIVVVEGYTDVMAAHLSGVTTAVATCGTSFGVDHIKLLRRIMGDDSGLGEVIFTFDPDAAGQKAAMRAFAEEQRFAAQTYVAVAPEGLDPCDLRLARGEQAVRDLIGAKQPMFEFVLRRILANYNLDSVEGRVAALREAAPVVADIRDAALRPGYTRELARLTGVEVSEAQVAVSNAVKAARSAGMQATGSGVKHGYAGSPVPDGPLDDGYAPYDDGGATPPASPGAAPIVLADDPSTRLERDALMALLQYPQHVGTELAAQAAQAGMFNPSLATVRDAVGANLSALESPSWVAQIQGDLAPEFRPLVTQLAVAPLPERTDREIARYCRAVVVALVERDLVRRKSELVGRLQRMGADQGEESREVQRALIALETQRRQLREE